ncbi:hypothetical protein WICMUC_004212 [Wickerhamomyces mucosus]|uniref:Glucosidase II subunit alpha n=1 Tax=Wickerhamomyces mucosus TaxID=1378264 RepID=A0A9P8PI47_9ASCO|nr:hypothetical protein WICMUC_004212 [Wickerhamomyces mucosus]
MKLLQFFCLVSLLILDVAFGVKHELFKRCDQSGFCRRNRHYGNEISKTQNKYYSINEESVKFGHSVITGDIQKSLNQSHSVRLPFTLEILENNNIRLQIDEDRSKFEFNHKLLQKERYNEAWKYAFNGIPKISKNYKVSDISNGQFDILYGKDEQYKLEVYTEHFEIIVKYHNEPQIIFNERSFLNVEHIRSKDNHESSLLQEELNFGSFQDSFKDSKADTLPFGPESVALDVTFQGFKHVYGIPEHADSLSLRDTTASEPYRLYNVDIFEYEVDSRLPMYGAIPLLVAHKPGVSAGLFWVNGADTYVDIKKQDRSVPNALREHIDTQTHWISESGIIDVVIFIGSSPTEITSNYAKLSGQTQLPQLFSLGYHQGRWNYNDEEDVLTISENMDKYEIPCDVIWLDLEYTDSRRYFTWKKGSFPDPERMLAKLNETYRSLVTLIDPHLKLNYEVSDQVSEKNLAFLDKNGKDFHGHCWPGESLWIDTFNPNSQEFWTTLFANDSGFAGDATNLHIWNDMNEPSVFSGPETTAPKDVITYGNVEIRSDHNIYGLTYHEATFEALKERYINKRPFVLTRSFFAGSQRSAAMWTGDNMSKWEYLKVSIQMILNQNIANMPFSGADIGGFFGNPSKELLTRWYQTGIWYPFFRAHAHIDSRRREPWVPGEPYTSLIRNAIRLRYRLLPLFYTKLYQSHVNGSLVLDPLFYKFPDNRDVFEIDDQFYIDGLLIKPVTEEGAESINIYIPDDEIHYDYDTFQKFQGLGDHRISTPLEKIPVLIRGGTILSRKDRYRRSSKLTRYDPYTLVIALDSNRKAKGNLYIDDGETYNYKLADQYLYLELNFVDNILNSEILEGAGSTGGSTKVEKIQIIGDDLSFEEIFIKQNDTEWSGSFEKHDNYYVVKNPNVDLSKNWSVSFR